MSSTCMDSTKASVAISGIFQAQRMSGQQRYAHGLLQHLAAENMRVVTPPDAVLKSALHRHAWTNLRYLREKGDAALFLTHQFPWYKSKFKTEILTVHDLFPLTHPEWYSSAYATYAANLIRRGVARADYILTVSEPVAAEVRERLGPRGSIHVIPNAAAEQFVGGQVAADAQVLSRLRLESGTFFVTLASGDPRKRLDVVVAGHAASRYRDIPLVAGGAAPSMTSRASAEAMSSKNVLTTGWISDDDLAVLYRHAIAFISASEAEGFGLPLVEAATAGSRVIATDLAIHRWTLGTYGNYFEVGSPKGLAEAIESVIEDKAPGPYGRRFTFADSAAQLGALLADLPRT